MKNSIIFLLAAVLNISAMASTTKVCFGSNQSSHTKGVVLLAQISKNEITLKAVNEEFYEGTFLRSEGTTESRDAKTYLEYAGLEGSDNHDQTDTILVDKDLLKANTSGLLQIRSYGEVFYNSVFFCRQALR